MFSFLRKQKWASVWMLTVDNIKYKDINDGKIWIHFFESDKGNRKIETACSIPDVSQEKVDEFIKSRDFYQTKIFRWLNGRYDPEIPRYSEIGEEDTANALRGKIA